MKLKLGFSTCPNDTFIFDAIVNKRIDTRGFEFDLVLADVEVLNKMAINNELDISKLSFSTYLNVWKTYKLLNSGAALGKANGPLLISKKKVYPDEVSSVRIGIPGKHTTANLLLSIAYPDSINKKEYLFSDIETAILENDVDAGLIIHETRFTYHKKGLKKIIDLGEFWENLTKLPLPLGGIVINRNIPRNQQIAFNQLLKESVEYAFTNPKQSIPFIKQYAQEINDDIINQHISLYVNDYTLDFGTTGKKSIEQLFKKAKEVKFTNEIPEDIFVG